MANMKKPVETLGNFEQLVLAAVLALGDDAYGMAVYEKVVEIGRRKGGREARARRKTSMHRRR